MAAMKVETEQRSSFSKLQEERIASRCIKPRVVLAKSVHVMEREALGARDHHGECSQERISRGVTRLLKCG